MGKRRVYDLSSETVDSTKVDELRDALTISTLRLIEEANHNYHSDVIGAIRYYIKSACDEEPDDSEWEPNLTNLRLTTIGEVIRYFRRFFSAAFIEDFTDDFLRDLHLSLVMKPILQGEIPRPMRARMRTECTGVLKNRKISGVKLVNRQKFSEYCDRLINAAGTKKNSDKPLPEFAAGEEMFKAESLEQWVAYYIRKFTPNAIKEVIMTIFDIYHEENFMSFLDNSICVEYDVWHDIVRQYPAIRNKWSLFNQELLSFFEPSILNLSCVYRNGGVPIERTHITCVQVRLHPQVAGQLELVVTYEHMLGAQKLKATIKEAVFISTILDKLGCDDAADEMPSQIVPVEPLANVANWNGNVGEA